MKSQFRLVTFLVFLASSLAGCATTTRGLVPPNTTPVLESGQGLLALAVTTDCYISFLTFEPKGTGGQSIMTEEYQEGTNLQLYAVRAGRYCLDAINWANSTYLTSSSNLCFDVRPGAFNYPGHFVMGDTERKGAISSLSLRTVPNLESLNALMKEKYPDLRVQFAEHAE